MTDKLPSGRPPATTSESAAPAFAADPHEGAGIPEASIENPGPFDELWDPDIETRPERIRRTRSRTQPEPRTRCGGPPRGKRRDTV